MGVSVEPTAENHSRPNPASAQLPNSQPQMPSHEDQLANLKRIEGQIRGIIRMIEDRRYCLDILNQCRSVHAALEGVEKKIFKRFLSVCVRNAFEKSTRQEEVDPLLDDIVKLLSRK